MITQKHLKECLSYNPDTGLFTWLERPRGHFKSISAASTVNTRFSGKTAGAESKSKKAIYWRIIIDGVSYKAHRLAWLYMYGDMPNGDIDHINGIHNDNRIINLRVVTTQENNKNLKLQCTNKTGIQGVSWHKHGGKWQVKIHDKNSQIYLGLYDSFFDACCIRKSAEVRYQFHENHGRR